MDLDMDALDLDGPSQASSKPSIGSKFKPKTSKLNPKPKTEPKAEPVVGAPQITKQEDTQLPPHATINIATSEPSPSSSLNDTVKQEDLKEDPMEEDDDEDRVVREIDVFFTPPFDSNTQLYVLQYPLRPCWRPYELDERCQEVRVKPKSSQVEVDLSLNLDPKNYDADVSDNLRIKKQTLFSSWKPPSTTGYAIGVLMGNKLHLNPVHAVVQLRPSMEHLKPGLSKKKSDIAREAIGNSVETNEAAGPSKKQGKRVGILNDQNTDDDESWIPLEYHGMYSGFSTKYREKMAAQECSSIPFSMSPYDYINSLCPGTSTDSSRANGLSRRYLLSLPLEKRLETQLREIPQLHRFNALKHLAPDDSVETVLGVLRQCAHLVQGLWVPKSSLLCQGGDALARDYILCLFSKSRIIKHAQLDDLKGLRENANRILNQLAFERPSFKDWILKEPPDVTFIKQNPVIVREQEQLWEGSEKRIKDVIHGAGKSGPGMRSFRHGSSINSDHIATRGVNGALNIGTKASSGETQDALLKALQKLFQIHKICSFDRIKQGLRDMAISKSSIPKSDPRVLVSAAYGVDDCHPEVLQAALSQVAVNIHGVYVSKTSSEHPEYDPLRKVVINIFCAKEPDAKLRKADIVEAAKISLKRDITTNEYNKIDDMLSFRVLKESKLMDSFVTKKNICGSIDHHGSSAIDVP